MQQFEHFIQAQKKIQKSLEPLIRAQKELQKSLEPLRLYERIQKKMNSLQRFIKQIEKLVEEAKLEKEILLKTGWWFTPSLLELPASQISSAFYKYKDGQKNAITNFFIEVYQGENCKYLKSVIRNWKKNIYFKPWIEIIKDAFRAHNQKKYSLSVPVLLLIAEGIASKYCKDKKVLEEAIKSKGGKKIKKALEIAEINDKNLSLEILFTAIDDRIFNYTGKVKSEARGYRHFLNRHAIMHGETAKYGTLKNSLQCFMLLDVLSILK